MKSSGTMIQSEARVRFVDFSIIRSHESLLAVHRSAAGKGLGYAARAGHLRTVEAFIGSLGVDVEAVDRAGWAATMRAARNGQTDIVNVLTGTAPMWRL
jgi:ankyrin repeat protein